MKKCLIPTTVILGFFGFSTMATAGESVTGSNASHFGKTLGKDWGGFISDGSKATNSGLADGDENTIVTLPIGGLPFQVTVSDPGVGNMSGDTNNGKEE